MEFLKEFVTPMTRGCAIYRTPLGCYENLIRSDLFIYSSRRSVVEKVLKKSAIDKKIQRGYSYFWNEYAIYFIE